MNDKTSKNLKFLMKFYFNSKSEKKKQTKTKETGPALQSIMANLLGYLHCNARQELMDSFEGN